MGRTKYKKEEKKSHLTEREEEIHTYECKWVKVTN
jgi:hypothetical protein